MPPSKTLDVLTPPKRRSTRRGSYISESENAPGKKELIARKAKIEEKDESKVLEKRKGNDLSTTNEDPLCTLAKHMSKINRILNKIHEHVSPKFTASERKKYGITEEYGGITGTLRPKSIERVARALLGAADDKGRALSKEFWLRDNESVFCDIGSGTGRPVFYFAHMRLRACVGFDIDPAQVMNSFHGYQKVKDSLRCPVALFKGDSTKIDSLAPVTHAFAFLGYSSIVKFTSALVARSPSVRVLVAIVLHDAELRENGLLHDDDDDIVRLKGIQMPGGNSYRAVVIPLTTSRKKRVAACTGKKCRRVKGAASDKNSFTEKVLKYTSPKGKAAFDAFVAESIQKQASAPRASRSRRAASNNAKEEKAPER